jgi:hypothetical protein
MAVVLWQGLYNSLTVASGLLSLAFAGDLEILTAAFWATAAGEAAATGGLTLIGIAIFGVIAAMALIADDLYTFSKGGDSLFGRMLQYFKKMNTELATQPGQKWWLLAAVHEAYTVLEAIRLSILAIRELGPGMGLPFAGALMKASAWGVVTDVASRAFGSGSSPAASAAFKAAPQLWSEDAPEKLQSLPSDAPAAQSGTNPYDRGATPVGNSAGSGDIHFHNTIQINGATGDNHELARIISEEMERQNANQLRALSEHAVRGDRELA